jgi:hypothetical protein
MSMDNGGLVLKEKELRLCRVENANSFINYLKDASVDVPLDASKPPQDFVEFLTSYLKRNGRLPERLNALGLTRAHTIWVCPLEELENGLPNRGSNNKRATKARNLLGLGFGHMAGKVDLVLIKFPSDKRPKNLAKPTTVEGKGAPWRPALETVWGRTVNIENCKKPEKGIREAKCCPVKWAGKDGLGFEFEYLGETEPLPDDCIDSIMTNWA